MPAIRFGQGPKAGSIFTEDESIIHDQIREVLSTRPSIGVLITYFNERNLLNDCLTSLLAQTERPDEIIVYDDASDVPADQYVPEGMPVRILRGVVNLGPARGRNILLHASKSDYVHFHDADDLFHPEWCSRVMRAIRESSADAVFTEISSITNSRLLCERVLGLRERLSSGEDLVPCCIRGAMLAPAGTYRRESVLSVKGYREELWQSEDYDFHIRLAASGIRYVTLNESLVSIRVRQASRSQNSREVWTSAVQAIRMLAREIPEKYHTDLAEAAAKAGSTLFRLDAWEDAKEAFALAEDLGPPLFRRERRLYRALARTFGPEVAEGAGALYRKWLPECFRRHLAASRSSI